MSHLLNKQPSVDFDELLSDYDPDSVPRLRSFLDSVHQERMRLENTYQILIDQRLDAKRRLGLHSGEAWAESNPVINSLRCDEFRDTIETMADIETNALCRLNELDSD